MGPLQQNAIDHNSLPMQYLSAISKMKHITQLPLKNGTKAISSCSAYRASLSQAQRCLHTSTSKPATVASITASGPPPTAPIPSAEHVDSRVARRRKQAELLKRGQDLRSVAGGTGGGTAKTKRFWKDVHVKHADGTDPIHTFGRFEITCIYKLVMMLTDLEL